METGTHKALGDVLLQFVDKTGSCSLQDKKLAQDKQNSKNINSRQTSGTDSNVLVGGLSAVQVVLGEELGQLRLDAAQRLVLTMKQHHQV